DAEQIIDQVAGKLNQLRNDLQKNYKDLKTNKKNLSLFDDGETDEAAFTKEWQKKRKKHTDNAQKEIEPLIYRYFGLTDQEICLVEDTVRVFIPGSTPNSWQSDKTVTLNPVNGTKVDPYADQGLKIYADILSQTLNQWAKAEDSDYCVCAEGGTDEQTGLTMVTLRLAKNESGFQEKILSHKLMDVLASYYQNISKKNGTMLYERDILLFQGKEIHIVRPNILLNWTRTAALNDAARIYGDIAIAGKEFA
ncbi:MAG: hypothetical protein V2I97_18260, partial [Desulfococcaceae bacterium]|nr:hypothetical protein [Desulfococcaceae bacterium]